MRQPTFKALLLQCERFGFVGNRSAFHHAEAWRLGRVCAEEIRIWSRLRAAAFDIPVRRIESLPVATQIGMAVRRTRRLVGKALPDDEGPGSIPDHRGDNAGPECKESVLQLWAHGI